MKKYRVNVTRTITLEQYVVVGANNDAEASQKVQDHYDAGKGGDPFVTFKNAKGFAKDAEGDEITERFEVSDAEEDE